MENAVSDYIEQVLTEFSEEFISQRIAYLQSKKINSSAQLSKSLHYELHKQAKGELMDLLISFENYGRYIDMRKLDNPKGGSELLSSLEDWIQRKGLEAKMVKKYQSRQLSLFGSSSKKLKKLPNNLLYRIAWGIIVKWRTHRRRRQWWNKPKSAALAELYNRVLAGLPEATAKDISNAFKNK